MQERVLVSIDRDIARVTLNRADKRNALDLAMFDAIVAAQKSLARNRDIRAVILDGNGKDFCSGLDIKSMLGDRSAALRLMWKWLPWRPNRAQAVSTGWGELRVPVIAAIHGRCWGGGLQIVLGADFRIVDERASLSVMEGKWGLIPDMGGTVAMRDIMPRDQAMRLAMTAETMDARQALERGLATLVTDDARGAAQALAEQFLDRSPDAIAAVKRLYRKSWRNGGLVLARETAYQVRIMAGANQRIAVRRQRGEPIPWRPAARW
ncbi:MAG: crotonase/enoyl-CoA hydratase family protein [Xanthomonadales bacterium]|nr:crotonase/enoyl-CoA hydratase family protein [Xanthomonadales bacterium]NIX12695.1 crotonase/enoyl-CoA hydratase family protein [Xanthomonadales bacterium]